MWPNRANRPPLAGARTGVRRGGRAGAAGWPERAGVRALGPRPL